MARTPTPSSTGDAGPRAADAVVPAEPADAISLLNATLEATADGILVVDREGRISKFNQTFLEMWRIPPAVVESRDDDRAIAFVLEQLRSPAQFLEKVRHLYGHPDEDSVDVLEFLDGRTFERYSRPQRQGNRIVGRVWSFRDVTRRKQAESALGRESQLAGLVRDVAGAANLARSPDEAFQKALDGVCRVTGWPVGHVYVPALNNPDLLVPGSLWHVDQPDRYDEFKRVTESVALRRGEGLPGRVLASRRPAWIVDITRDPNFPRNRVSSRLGLRAGFAFPVVVGERVIAVLEFFAEEAVEQDAHLLQAMADVGLQLGRVVERSEAEVRQRESGEQFRGLAEAAHDAIVQADASGLIRYMNPAGRTMFGVSEEEALGKPLTILMPERFRPLHTQGFGRYIKTGESHVIGRTVELAGRRADGTEFPLELSLSAATSGGNRVFTGILRDITDRKRLERESFEAGEREKEVEHLRRLDRFRSEFVNAAAHELNTPLTPIHIQLHLLEKRLRDVSSTEELERVIVIRRNFGRLESLVHDLLDSARIQSQKFTLSQATFAPEPLFREVAESYFDLCRDAGIVMELRIATLPSIHADRSRVGQVLYNLLSNAIKFTPTGGRVTVEAKAGEAELTVTVTDTGVGIPSDQVVRLFQPFVQVHEKSRIKTTGTGLGLYVSRNIVERHGGRIWCQSGGNGQGSTFGFTIPLKPLAKDAQPAVAPAA